MFYKIFALFQLMCDSLLDNTDAVQGKYPSRIMKSNIISSLLTLSKELPKTLGAGLLPNPLAVAAAMAAAASSNQLALRPPGPTPHHHHHLLQGTPLSLLRPAPGPIRTTHGPILFTPY